MTASTAFGEGVLLGGITAGTVIALVARREVVRLRQRLAWYRRWSSVQARQRFVPQHAAVRREGAPGRL